MARVRTPLALILLLAAAAGGCDSASVTPTPMPTPPLGSEALVWIDQTWTASNGIYTFTGGVDPDGLPVRVVLEIGSGPPSAPTFGEEVLVAGEVAVLTPLRIQTALPEGGETCVRFSITGEAGRTSSRALCVQNDRLPEVGASPSS